MDKHEPKKRGRPRTDSFEPLDATTMIRLTSREKKQFSWLAKQKGFSLSKFLREELLAKFEQDRVAEMDIFDYNDVNYGDFEDGENEDEDGGF